jgi:hypothetical protein
MPLGIPRQGERLTRDGQASVPHQGWLPTMARARLPRVDPANAGIHLDPSRSSSRRKPGSSSSLVIQATAGIHADP